MLDAGNLFSIWKGSVLHRVHYVSAAWHYVDHLSCAASCSQPASRSLACLQITGDPNVPAGKVSFCVSAENARMGTYNGFEREEVEPGVIDDVFRDIGAALTPCNATA